MSHVDRSGRHALSRGGVVALLVCCSATGCFRAEEEALDEAQAVSLALTRGIHFDGAQLESGPLPKETDQDVRLMPLDSLARLTPGSSGELSFLVDHAADEDDPVEVTLMQFGETASQHLEVRQLDRTEPSDPRTLPKVTHSFNLKSDVCAKLCNKLHTVKLLAALRTKSGKRGPPVDRMLELDCSEHGDSAFCSGDDGPVTGGNPRRDGGSSTSAGGSGGTDGKEGLCGNNRIEAGESCDGTDLGGTQCISLGFVGGQLFCDPVSCTFDDSMCLQTGGDSGGSGG